MDRRLAAILAARLSGGTAGGDPEAAARGLRGHIDALEPVIALNGGRIVRMTGEGFLAEFPSVVFAVACAVAMQGRVAERNEAQVEDLRVAFRMGVHVGDVVVSGEDLLGDGVTVALGLQELAKPGGIVVSRRVQEDVADKVDAAFRPLGEQAMKGVARPLMAFSVGPASPRWRCWPSTTSRRARRRTISRTA